MLNLAQYDQKRMAVLVPVGATQVVLRGGACYFRDDALGNCLRIDNPEEPGMEVFLAEDQFNGQIVEDDRYGCDFCVRFGPDCGAN